MSMPAFSDYTDPKDLLPGEMDIRSEAAKIFAEPDEWMRRKHPMLGGRSPDECLEAKDEQPVRDLLRTIIHVGQT
jgi:hypothetical protein